MWGKIMNSREDRIASLCRYLVRQFYHVAGFMLTMPQQGDITKLHSVVHDFTPHDFVLRIQIAIPSHGLHADPEFRGRVKGWRQ